MTTPEATGMTTPRPWTPDPWGIWTEGGPPDGRRLFDADDSLSGDAALIVEAVNAYDRLRRIEAAAREFFDDEHECLHDAEPPCGLALLRAALDEESQP